MAKKIIGKKSKDDQDFKSAYESHGIVLQPAAKTQATGICPFCGGEDKLFVSLTTGQFDCKTCPEKGNLFTILNKVHREAKSITSDDQYTHLSDIRGITTVSLKKFGVAYNPLTGEWLVPVYNPKGGLSDIKRWREGSKILYKTATCGQQLYNSAKIQAKGPVYICEGEWDAMALQDLLRRAKLTEYSIVAVPGCDQWDASWTSLFHEREVVLLYDNDEPGFRGMEKARKALAETALSIRSIEWKAPKGQADYREKYDIRDYVKDNIKKPKEAWQHLKGMLVDSPESNYKPPSIERSSFTEVMEDVRKAIYVSPGLEDALIVLLATCFSARLDKEPDNPVWLFLTGPSGSGKTMMLRLHEKDRKRNIYQSRLKPTALVSGMDLGADDPSLLARLPGKVLLVKDFTTILGLPIGLQEDLFSVLRDAYDGAVSVPYGNKVGERRYDDCHFTMIAAVTDAIHGFNQTELGERFIKFELMPVHDPKEQIRMALRHKAAFNEYYPLAQESVHAFLTNDFGSHNCPTINEDFSDRIVSLSMIVAHLRSKPKRGRGGMLAYRPRVEVATRLGAQLNKMARCVAFVLGDTEVTERSFRYAQQCAFDTAIGFPLEILQQLHRYEQATKEEIAQRLQLTIPTVDTHLKDMLEMGTVEFTMARNGKGPGRPAQRWYMSDEIKQLWDEAKIVGLDEHRKDSVRTKRTIKKVVKTTPHHVNGKAHKSLRPSKKVAKKVSAKKPIKKVSKK